MLAPTLVAPSGAVSRLEAEVAELRADRRELTRRLDEARTEIIVLEAKLEEQRQRTASAVSSQREHVGGAFSATRTNATNATTSGVDVATLRNDNHALLEQVRRLHAAAEQQRRRDESFVRELGAALGVQAGQRSAVEVADDGSNARAAARLQAARSCFLRHLLNDQAEPQPRFDLCNVFSGPCGGDAHFDDLTAVL